MSFQRRTRVKKKKKAVKDPNAPEKDWLEYYSKQLNEDGGVSEQKILNDLRSAIREVWVKSPVKLAFFHSTRQREFREGSRKKWIHQCAICKDFFGGDKVEVDHIKGEHPLRSFDDVIPYVKSILCVTAKDLQLLCFDCHNIKTYAERYSVSLEDAKIMKKVISLQKDKLDKQFLIDKGLKPESNAAKRKDQLLEYFKTNGGLDSA